MYELSCPNCSASAQYDFNDYLLMCPQCSCTFQRDLETGQKEIYNDHYIVPHSATPVQVKEDVLEWLARMHHKKANISQEYKFKALRGLCIPYWIVSIEAHTAWKGLVKRENRQRLDHHLGTDWLNESGQFRRNYRWAISARKNICEAWGLTRLHKPKERITVKWDGFPLDSTFTRGQVRPADSDRNIFDAREKFEIKFGNGLPITGIQVSEDEALRRARMHVELYHLELSRLNTDHLTDLRTETELIGIQLVHLPFWFATYFYQPRSPLKHFIAPKEKHVLLSGYNNGVLDGELPIKRNDKIYVNTILCAFVAIIFLLLGVLWHGGFLIVALFFLCITLGGAYLGIIKASYEDTMAYSINPEAKSAA